MGKYIEIPKLIAAGVAPTQARIFADPLSAACEQFDITTAERVAAFVAQAVHESAHFTRLEEDLYYKTPERIRAVFSGTVKSLEHAQNLVRNPKGLANVVYANRNGNGPEGSGDGWTFRGRGIFQTTGRGNYARAQQITGQPFVQRPDMLVLPEHACMAAAGYWNDTNCNRLADRDDFDAITRAINGQAMEGANERRQLFALAMEAFA